MKKAIIVIIIAVAIGVCSFGYFKTKNSDSISNKVLNTNATATTQASNLASKSSLANSDKLDNSNSDKKENNNAQSIVNTNVNTNTNAKNNTTNVKNNRTNDNTTNVSNSNSNSTSTLSISSNFTSDQIQTLENIIKAEKISPGAGTDSLVINLDYYSVVNGQKYYAIYGNTIPGTNWYMAGAGPFPTAQGNYSQVQFIAYANQNGKQISQAEFLNGKLSFNPSNTSNLSKQDISNMIKKTAIMYATYSGFNKTAQVFNASELTNYVGNITVNINNTKNINGETYYEVEYKSGEPFYISLTGNIYVSQEHYLSTIFKAVPPQTNAHIKESMKGI